MAWRRSDDWLSVGKIVGVQGLQGELRVNPASDFPERFHGPGPPLATQPQRGVNPKRSSSKKAGSYPANRYSWCEFEGINNRNAAEALSRATS